MNIGSGGRLGRPGNLWGRSEGVVFCEDGLRMKFRFVDNFLSRAGGMGGRTISTRDCAVGNKEVRILNYMTRPSETAPIKPSNGSIYGKSDEWFLESVCGVSCLSLVPSFYRGMGLSHYLEGLSPGVPRWQVLPSDSESELRIWHPDPRNWTSDNVIGYVLTLNLEKNGLITSVEYRAGAPGDDIFEVGTFASVEDLQLIETDGLWLPTACIYGWYHDNERTGERMWSMANQHTIEWSGINGPVDDEALVLEFPKGLPVSTPLERKGWEIYRFFGDNLQYAQYYAGSRGAKGYVLATLFLILMFIVVVLGPVVIIRRWRARRETKT
jgi:hypothetical protein